MNLYIVDTSRKTETCYHKLVVLSTNRIDFSDNVRVIAYSRTGNILGTCIYTLYSHNIVLTIFSFTIFERSFHC